MVIGKDDNENMKPQSNQYNIAIIARDSSIYAWQRKILERVLELENINVSMLLLSHALANSQPIALKFVHHIERYLYSCQPIFFEEQAISDVLSGVERHSFDDNSFPELENIDFAINFTEAILPDELLRKPRLGVWSVFIGDKEKVSSQLTGVNDFISENDVIELGLQVEKPSNKENIMLYQSTTSIDMASLCRTAEQCLHKTSFFIPHYLRQIDLSKSSNELGFTQSKTLKNNLSVTKSSSVVWQLLKRLGKKIDHKYRAREQWSLLYAKNVSNDEVQDINFNLSSFSLLTPPKDRFWSDPFVITHEDKHYIFFEELLFERDLGHLCCMQLFDDGTHSKPVKILEKEYHLSYPYIFAYENQYYMIPESGDHQCIELYKSFEFPYKWEFDRTLMDNIRAYDSTLFEHDGLWWLFTCIADDEKSSSREDLHLFYATSPLSTKWQPHALNPVISDAGSARPAGKIFLYDNKIYRPSQNCAGSYGAGLNLCEITVLSTERYSEKVVSQMFPDWDKRFKGLHTFNFNKYITVSDVLVDRRDK